MVSPVAAEFIGAMSKDYRQIAGMWTRDGRTSALLTHPDAQATWVTDPAVHSVRYISVKSHVQLKVVDWGGSGRPLRRSLDRLSSEPGTRETKGLMAQIARELPAFEQKVGETIRSLETEPERPGPSKEDT